MVFYFIKMQWKFLDPILYFSLIPFDKFCDHFLSQLYLQNTATKQTRNSATYLRLSSQRKHRE